MPSDPSTYRNRVSYAWSHTEIGRVLVASTWKGVCFTALSGTGAMEQLTKWVERHEPGATLVEDRRALRPILEQIAAYARGDRKRFDVHLDLRGTAFQRAVWEADRKIPYGQTRTYAEVASAIGRPRAVRAVGGANGKNPVPLFVPCHRIVARDGLGGFTGGLHHKRRLLALEGSGSVRLKLPAPARVRTGMIEQRIRAVSALGVGALIAVATAVFRAAGSGPPGLPTPLPVAVWTADRDAGELCGLDRDLHVARKVALPWPVAVRARADGGAWVLCAAEGTPSGSCRLERVEPDGRRRGGVDLGPCTGLASSLTADALVIERERLLRIDDEGTTSVVLGARGLSCATETGDSIVAGTSLGEILRVRDGSLETRALDRAVVDVAEGPVAGSAWVLLDAGGATLGLLDSDLALRWTVPTGLRCAHLAPVPGEERVWIADTERASVRRFGPGGTPELDRADLPLAGLDRVVPWDDRSALVVAPGAILHVDGRGHPMPGQGGFAYLVDAD